MQYKMRRFEEVKKPGVPIWVKILNSITMGIVKSISFSANIFVMPIKLITTVVKRIWRVTKHTVIGL